MASEITTGASADLQTVSRYARAMVTRFGMSDRLGPMMFGQQSEMVFLGREISEQRDYSEAVAEIIDEEVKKIVDEAYERARQVLTENRDKLELIAQRLLEVETIDFEEFLELMGEPGSVRRKRTQQPFQPGKPVTKEDKDKGNEAPPRLGTAAGIA